MRVPLPALWKEALRRRFANWSVIPMLHRVDRPDPNRLDDNERLKISPELLEGFLITARRSGWSFVSLDELSESLERGRVPRKTISMTLDDGYRDNLTVAAPIFRAYGVPFCVYVTSGLLDRTAPLWWYDLEAIILASDSLRGPEGQAIECGDATSRQKAFSQLKKAIMSNDPAIRVSTRAWVQEQLALLGAPDSQHGSIMTREELIELATDPFATVGAHTVTHPVLLSLTDEEAAREMVESKWALESCIGRQVRHFAYPFGGDTAAGSREFRIARESGFRSAVTTRAGRLRKGTFDLFALPRLNFTADREEGLVPAFGARTIFRACENASK